MMSLKSTNDGTIPCPNSITSHLLVRGKSTTHNTQQLFDLMYDILCDAQLDNQDRVVEIIKEAKASMETSVVSSGHSYAATRIGARCSALGAVGESMSGVSMLATLNEQLVVAQNNWSSMCAQLLELRESIVDAGGVTMSISGDANTLSSCMPITNDFLSRFPKNDHLYPSGGHPWARMHTLQPEHEYFSIPTQVNS